MASVLFVHGTGVRKASYLTTFAVLQDAFDNYPIEHKLEPCLWGDDLGSKTPVNSLPDPIPAKPAGASLGIEAALARWELLYRDPIFELRLLKNRPRTTEPRPPTAARPDHELWSRIEAYVPSDQVRKFLDRWRLDSHWPEAWGFVVSNDTAREVVNDSQEEIGEPAQAFARAVVASLLNEAEQANTPLIDGGRRDQLVDLLIDDWEAKVAGIGTFLLSFFADSVLSAATPIVKWKRGNLSEAAAPAAGDVLLYQARGEGIRRYILKCIEGIDSEVVLLTHSLGGIACVDLLATQKIPQVRGLITVASQAPLLYEIGALCGIATGKNGLPDHFPKWLNIYDPYDFLSYVARPVFDDERVSDLCIESGQPFPHSHSAYWTNDQTWDAIAKFLR